MTQMQVSNAIPTLQGDKPVLLGRSAQQQLDIRHSVLQLDGTANKSNLGSNAIFASARFYQRGAKA